MVNNAQEVGRWEKYAAHGNGHPPDHYVEFLQGWDQNMVGIGLTGSGNVLDPHFVEQHLDTRESTSESYVTTLYRGTFVLTISIGMICGGSKMEYRPIPAMQQLRQYLRGQFSGRVMTE